MRVTKLISEYVRKTIEAKLPYGEPTQTFKQHQQALINLRDQLEEKVNTYAKELLAGVDNLPEGFEIKLSNYRVFDCTSYGSPMREAAAKHESEIRERRAKAIENVLVELELGATKADLERLIAEAISK